MFKRPGKEFLNSEFRSNQWRQAEKFLKLIEKALPIKSIYLVGSFTTKKKTPGDIDIIVYLETKEKLENSKWAIDFTISPDNAYGKKVLQETEEWVKRKYGIKKSLTIKLK